MEFSGIPTLRRAKERKEKPSMKQIKQTGLLCLCLALLLLLGCAAAPAGSGPSDPAPATGEQQTVPSSEDAAIEPTAPEPAEPSEPTEPSAPPETEPPAPPEPPAPSELELSLTEKLAGLQGEWSVYVKNLDTGESFCIHDEPMVAASLIKLYIAGAYYTTDPMAEDETYCRRADTMINVSSNESTNVLIDLLGMDAVNDFIRSRGDERSVLNRKMNSQSDLDNYVTTRVCGEILEDICRGTYVSEAASARLLQNLKDQERTWKIPAGVPAGVQTANKTGELSDTENDAAIVWSSGGTYILCVMSTDLTSVGAARQAIVEISREVYDYFTSEEQSAQTP